MGIEIATEVPQNKRGQKLYYYLSRLSAEDLDNFCHYLQSPLLGNSPQMSRMVRTIQGRVLGTDRVTIDADIFEEEFFPDQPLDEKKTKYIRIRLIQLQDKLMDFLSFMDYRQDRNARDIHLLKSLYKRGMEKHFEKIHADIEAQPPVKADGEYLMYRLWRSVVLNDFLTERRASSESTGLEELHERLDMLFVHMKLKYSSAVYVKSLSGREGGYIKFVEEVKAYAFDFFQTESHESAAYALVHNLFQGLYLRNEPDIADYEKLRLMITFSSESDASEIRDLFNYAQSFCLHQLAKGKGEFRKEITSLYNLILRSMEVFEGGMLPARFYRNAIVNTMRIGSSVWAEEFLEKYKDRVAGNQDNLVYLYNKSYIEYHKKNLHHAHELIYNRINEFDDEALGLAARVLIVRILWELKEYRWLLPQVESLRQLLLREGGIAESERENHLLFVRCVRNMCQAAVGNPDKIFKIFGRIKSDIERRGKSAVLVWVMHQVELVLSKRTAGEG